jgi:SAM-dependent methyltransferase
MNLIRRLPELAMAGEEWWFDVTRGVRTAGTAFLKDLTILSDASDSKLYMPVRPRRARQALRALPIRDYAEYTFIDMGSGKGRMLLLAAECPFRRILGIEFAAELHRQAVENIAACRGIWLRCRQIESVAMDAADFRFPDDNLVLYFFNPFGCATMRRVLEELRTSLKRLPRDVLLVTIFPEFEALIGAEGYLRLCRRLHRCHIYRAYAAGDFRPGRRI